MHGCSVRFAGCNDAVLRFPGLAVVACPRSRRSLWSNGYEAHVYCISRGYCKRNRECWRCLLRFAPRIQRLCDLLKFHGAFRPVSVRSTWVMPHAEDFRYHVVHDCVDRRAACCVSAIGSVLCLRVCIALRFDPMRADVERLLDAHSQISISVNVLKYCSRGSQCRA